MNGAMFVDRGHSFVAVPRAILPSRPPTLQPRRLGAGQGWPICGPPWSASEAATYARCCRGHSGSGLRMVDRNLSSVSRTRPTYGLLVLI